VEIQALVRGTQVRKELRAQAQEARERLRAQAEERTREGDAQVRAAVEIQALARGTQARKGLLRCTDPPQKLLLLPESQTARASMPFDGTGPPDAWNGCLALIAASPPAQSALLVAAGASAGALSSDGEGECEGHEQAGVARAVQVPAVWGDEEARSVGSVSANSAVHEQTFKRISGATRRHHSIATGSAPQRAALAATPSDLARASSSLSSSPEDCAAENEFLQKVVKQLESDDPHEAKSAAAALEYLVSSSDPKKPFVQWTWSAEGAKANRRALGMFPGLWRNLLGLLVNSNPAIQAQVCGAMSKLGFRNTKNVLEMIKYPKMLMALTDLLDMDKHSQTVVVQAWRVLQNFVSGMEEIKVVLCSTEHLLMRIKEACTRVGVSAEVRMRAVSVIMHASSSDEARLLLVKARVAEEALQVVMSADSGQKEEATRIRATLASANLCGREERSILSTAPKMLRAIGETIVHAFHGTEYHDIKWSLAGVMLPLFNLSCSDSNKKVFSQCGTVVLLLQAVKEGANILLGSLASKNADQVEDKGDWSSETLELILRTLANFTFDADAKDQMLRADALVILTDILASLKAQRDNSESSGGGSQWRSAILITEDILYMLSEKNEDMITDTRLQTRGVDDDSVEHKDEAMPDGKQQHIMISYSWAQGKDFVVQVSSGLRKCGFEVWRDEEGSQLVRKMMGSSMEIMATAIEHADVVVIFVSRAYRDSYNCKLEGKYAQVRERAGLTKILFVMMEEDFTPQANGGVDGWLGMLIGDNIWYPGWDPGKSNETVSELTKAIHKMRNDTKEAARKEAEQRAKTPMANELFKTSGPIAHEREPLGGLGPNATLTLKNAANRVREGKKEREESNRCISSASSDDGIVLGRREMKGGPYIRPRQHSMPLISITDEPMGDVDDLFDQESSDEVGSFPRPLSPFVLLNC
jgi:hypothetical protein